MMKQLATRMFFGVALLAAQISFAAGPTTAPSMTKLESQVRRELVTLPYYNVFDSFSFHVDADTVTLFGKVTRPTLKSDAANVVKNLEGVTTVDNRIEVLPLSPNDDRLRASLYRAIYGHSALQTLAVRAVPPIHIIVENGKVTLEGAVANSLQKTIAGMQADAVPGVFSVTNILAVDNPS